MMKSLKTVFYLGLLSLGLALQGCASFSSSTPSTTISSSGAQVSLPGEAMHHFELKEQIANWLVVDERYIYWTTNHDPRHIYRLPLEGAESEIIVTSQYSDGDVSGMRPIRVKNWLVFLDSPISSNYKTWSVRAVDVTNGDAKTLLEANNDEASWPGPMVDGYGDEIVWSQTRTSPDGNCVESILAIQNIVTEVQQEIDRVCIEENYLWSNPQMYSDKIVVERDLPDSKGGGNNIFLFDRQAQTLIQLTDNGQSSMPIIADPWIAWKDAPRFDLGRSVTIYDTVNRTQRSVSSPGKDPLDPRLSGHWLYWPPSASQPFYVYDLASGQLQSIIVPGSNEDIVAVAVNNNMVAWCRNLNFQSADIQGSIIEWGTLTP